LGSATGVAAPLTMNDAFDSNRFASAIEKIPKMKVESSPQISMILRCLRRIE